MKTENEVAQSFLTLSDPMDCSPPGSSVHGIFQARVLEWVAVAFSLKYYEEYYLLYFILNPLIVLFFNFSFMIDLIFTFG